MYYLQHFVITLSCNHLQGNFRIAIKNNMFSVKAENIFCISVRMNWKSVLKAKDFKDNEITHQNTFGSWGKLKRLSHDLTHSFFKELSLGKLSLPNFL